MFYQPCPFVNQVDYSPPFPPLDFEQQTAQTGGVSPPLTSLISSFAKTSASNAIYFNSYFSIANKIIVKHKSLRTLILYPISPSFQFSF